MHKSEVARHEASSTHGCSLLDGLDVLKVEIMALAIRKIFVTSNFSLFLSRGTAAEGSCRRCPASDFVSEFS